MTPGRAAPTLGSPPWAPAASVPTASGRISDGPVNRWLILSLGLAIAAGAAYALLAGEGSPPLDRIDDDSRARLERVLRDSERGP